MNLNENNSEPYYMQIQNKLRSDILNGIYKNGDLLPSEKELQDIFGVSRITIRKALEGLSYEGLIIRRQGKGTIVSRNDKMSEKGSRLKSFSEKVSKFNDEVSTEVLDKKLIVAPGRVQREMNLGEKESVIYLKRVRYVNKEPIAIFNSYLRTDIGLTINDDYSGSLYDLIEKYNKIDYGEKLIRAKEAYEEEAEILNIKPGEAVLMILNKTVLDNGLIAELAEGIYRDDKYEFEVKLKR